jgi:hypothetical protein
MVTLRLNKCLIVIHNPFTIAKRYIRSRKVISLLETIFFLPDNEIVSILISYLLLFLLPPLGKVGMGFFQELNPAHEPESANWRSNPLYLSGRTPPRKDVATMRARASVFKMYLFFITYFRSFNCIFFLVNQFIQITK